MSKHAGGRETDPLILKNFTRLTNANTKTNRYRVSCKHCSIELEHRDNRCLDHLAYPAKCKDAPQDVRARALTALMKKSGLNPTDSLALSGSEAQPINLDREDAELVVGKKQQGPSGRVIAVKRTHSSLDAFLARPMGEDEVDKANVLLLRYVFKWKS